jgi:hypothetical protein
MENYDPQHEIAPPWLMFPEADFLELSGAWGGFRQGAGEAWLHGVWFPFWHQLREEQRISYVERHRASPVWSEYLLLYWMP